MTLPRLTSALRAFSTVTQPYDDPRPLTDAQDLERKRRLHAERRQGAQLSWQQLCAMLKGGGTKGSGKGSSVDKDLKSLSRAARAIGEGELFNSETMHQILICLFTFGA